MDRALRANLIAKSGTRRSRWPATSTRCLLDKTGTITMGNRRATQFLTLGDLSAADVGVLAALASAADQTPEGKSIVDLYRRQAESDLLGNSACWSKVHRLHRSNAHERCRSARWPG